MRLKDGRAWITTARRKRALAAALLFALLSLLAAGGCSGKKKFEQWGGLSKEEWLEQKKKRDQESEAKAAAEKKSKAVKPRQASIKKPSAAASAKEITTPPRKPAPYALPRDYQAWSWKDYQFARWTGNARLIGAIEHLERSSEDKLACAELLAGLLDPASDDGDELPERPSRPLTAAMLKAITSALAANDAPPAWKALEQLGSGGYPTIDASAGRAAVVKALLDRPSAEADDLLLKLLTSTVPASQSGAARAAARDPVLALVKERASFDLRRRLAEYVIADDAPAGVFARFWPCLADARPENLAAQAILYQSDRVDRAARGILEDQLGAASAAAMNRRLGFAPLRSVKSALGEAAAESDPQLVEKWLWNDAFAAAVQRQMSLFDGLATGKRVALLAGSIPHPTVRDAMARTLKMRWEEDPGAIDAMGATAEPGLLVVLKMLPLKESAARRNSAAAASRASKTSSPTKGLQNDAKNEERWEQFSESVIRAMCRRFREAASDDELDEPIAKPHPGAEIAATYQFDWRDGLAASETVDPAIGLRVRYARYEQLSRPMRTLAYYRRQFSNRRERSTQEDVWIESLAQGMDGAYRSVDVLVTKPKERAPSATDSEQRVVVEMIAVDCAGTAEGTARR